MRFVDTELPGCVVIEPRIFCDDRGYFYEVYNAEMFAANGLQPCFVQSNVSSSVHGVLRGLHFQWPTNQQGKLVSVLDGEVYDVAVDLRRGSPCYGRWTAVVLGAKNKRQMWIPPGFAHGFQVLSESAVFTYLCTAPYDPSSDSGIRWDDPQLAIDWPIANPLLSPKDAAAPLLADLPPERLPDFDGNRS